MAFISLFSVSEQQGWMQDFGSAGRGGGWGEGVFVLDNFKQKTSEILYFHKNPHENEIILAKRGGSSNPLWIFPWTVLHQDPQVRVPRPHQGCESSDTLLSRGQKWSRVSFVRNCPFSEAHAVHSWSCAPAGTVNWDEFYRSLAPATSLEPLGT